MLSTLSQQFINQVDRNLTKEPTGFVSPVDVAVAYDSTTRKITVTGNTRALWRGTEITALVSGWESAAHADVAGIYFLYFDGTSFVWSNTVWEFTQVMIAFVSYQSADKWAIRECHGLMENECHREFHYTIGTYRLSGGTLSDFTLNSTTAAARRPLVSACTIFDEDVPSSIAAISTEVYTQFYLTGATGVTTFAVDAADIVPLLTNNPYYNQFTGGAWQQTLLPNNNYMCVWLIAMPVTSDSVSQKYRFLWMQGQTQGTLASQQALAPSGLSLGTFQDLAPEFVFIAKVILRYTSGNWILTQVDTLTGSRATQVNSPAGLYLSSVTTDATLTGDGTPSAPLSVASSGGLTEEQVYTVAHIASLMR
jgi:hypothetical protein